jgi:hypothetical protein
MAIEFDVQELDPPQLQFGGSGTHSDPKVGLEIAGPFDLRFQSARNSCWINRSAPLDGQGGDVAAKMR